MTTTTEETTTQDVESSAAPTTALQDLLAEAVRESGQGDRDMAVLPLLRAGFEELATLAKPREFPEFFTRYAQQTGIRMLLLKRWTSGLQVFMETNIRMPSEARRKRPDGRAPIPCERGDVFQASGVDAEVYAGFVPIKHFPLDLTLMLGRGSRDRRIIILPLPSHNHWNTFVYLDGGKTGGRALEVAEVLARYALTRMINLSYRGSRNRGHMSTILKAEELRRHRLPNVPAVAPAAPQPEATPTFLDTPAVEVKVPVVEHRVPVVEPRAPVVAPKAPAAEPRASAVEPKAPTAEVPVAKPSAPRPGLVKESEPPRAKVPDADPFVAKAAAADTTPASAAKRAITLTPESILRQSGELPALPKAACHIMAVIEDPRTTATSLEKALAMDQTLTAKVLRIANSPFYGAVREIRTVSEAVVRLGFVAIRNWTLVTAARSVFLAPGAGMLYQRIWKQSVLSAMAAQLVAQSVGGQEPESAFIGGLMQNIGQLVLARSHPELFHEILAESEETGSPYHDIERQLIGFDHGELGAHLIGEWNLSPELEEAVRWHHRFEHEEAGNTRMAAIIALGEEIALRTGPTNGGEQVEDGAESEAAKVHAGVAARFLGLTETKVADLLRSADGLHIDPHFFS